MGSRSANAGDASRFGDAIAALAQVRLRPEVTLTDMPAPQRIAPYAVAFTAELALAADEQPLASGRFVVLHDPDGPEAWGGTWRVVTFARASLEPEFGAEPLLGEVGWSWLTDALDGSAGPYAALGGTVTRVVSESFAALADREASVEMEIRASWTPLGPALSAPAGARGQARAAGSDDGAGDLGDHLYAWAELLCTIGGLPPLPPGVTALPGQRR